MADITPNGYLDTCEIKIPTKSVYPSFAIETELPVIKLYNEKVSNFVIREDLLPIPAKSDESTAKQAKERERERERRDGAEVSNSFGNARL